MPDNVLFQAATWIIPLIFAIVLHEISHGWVAYAFGDPTAKDLGRLSPNPIRHVDPIGTIALPLILAITGAPIFGWAKPVPVVARRLRNPRFQMILVALAGPGMNLFLALAAAAAFAVLRATVAGGGLIWLFIWLNLVNFVAINIFLAIFNLLPIPPFDGGHVVEGLLPRSLSVHYAKLKRFAFPLFIFLLLILPRLVPGANIVSRLVRPPVDWLIGILLPGLQG
ncbi:MAG: site-2 protease family protein [Alphaproteobacteria bacterium]|nr:site-2 protease family protein [Alphaproteobacteria bacterium]